MILALLLFQAAYCAFKPLGIWIPGEKNTFTIEARFLPSKIMVSLFRWDRYHWQHVQSHDYTRDIQGKPTAFEISGKFRSNEELQLRVIDKSTGRKIDQSMIFPLVKVGDLGQSFDIDLKPHEASYSKDENFLELSGVDGYDCRLVNAQTGAVASHAKRKLFPVPQESGKFFVEVLKDDKAVYRSRPQLIDLCDKKFGLKAHYEFSDMFECEDLCDGKKPKTLKIRTDDYLEDISSAKLMRNEIQVVKMLNSVSEIDTIPRLLDSFELNGKPEFAVYSPYNGNVRDIESILLDFDIVKDLLKDVLGALVVLHQQDLVHRAIFPSNIFYWFGFMGAPRFALGGYESACHVGTCKVSSLFQFNAPEIMEQIVKERSNKNLLKDMRPYFDLASDIWLVGIQLIDIVFGFSFLKDDYITSLDIYPDTLLYDLNKAEARFKVSKEQRQIIVGIIKRCLADAEKRPSAAELLESLN